MDVITVLGGMIDPVSDSSNTQLSSAVPAILNGIIFALALVAVVVVVIGGVGYMTSAGDPGKVEKSKKTIVYACIGLAVCALSFAIVNWVVGSVLGGNSSGGDGRVDYGSIDNEYACVQQGGEWVRGSAEGSGTCKAK